MFRMSTIAEIADILVAYNWGECQLYQTIVYEGNDLCQSLSQLSQ